MAMLKTLLRTVLPFVFAIGIALGLFWFMQWLIEPDAAEPIATVRGGLDRVEITPEREQQTTQTAASEAPPPPTALAEAAAALPVAPALARPSTPSAELSFTPIAMPGLSVEAEVPTLSGDAIGLSNIPMAANVSTGSFQTGNQFGGRRVVPISTRSPCFPQAAYDRQVEGYVEVLFVVKSNGSVANPRIVNAEPKGLFEAAAVEAVRTWYYDAEKLRGATVEVLQKLPFTLRMYAYNGARKC